MKTILAAAVLLFSFTALAGEVTVDSLQGKWKIVTMGKDIAVDTNDVWEFRGNLWIAWSEGKALTPDPFTLKNNVIDLGYGKIKILEKSKDAMKTQYGSIVYTLRKIQ